MKKINFLFAGVIILTLFLLISCNVEPIDPVLSDQIEEGNGNGSGNGNTGGGTGGSIVGRYLMTAFNTSIPTDLNGDGNASTNQINETTCFNNNDMILNSNNTFTSTQKGVDLDLTGTSAIIDCYTDPIISGTWVVSGSVLTLSYTEGNQQFTEVFAISGNTLTLTALNGEIVGTTSTGEPVYLDADVSMVYTKQ